MITPGHFKEKFNHFIPPHSARHTFIKNSLAYMGLARRSLYSDQEYQEWITGIEPGLASPIVNDSDEKGVLVSLVIPFWNTPDRYLDQLMNSLEAQTIKGWELVMVDVSDEADRSAAVQAWSDRDDRYQYVRPDKNHHISINTNKGIEQARGEYIAFADHDDLLSPIAMNEIIRSIWKNAPDIIYSDEDKLTDDGKLRHSPYFKPNWSPHLFWFTNYTNHLSVVKKELIDRVGGLDDGYNGSQDYDLLLRIHASSDKSLNVIHIPKVLYHWREAPQSTASNHSKKSYAFVAGKKALDRYFKRMNIAATTHYIENSPGFYKQVFLPDPRTRVSVYIADDIDNRYIKKLQSLTETNLKVSYVSNGRAKIEDSIVIEITKECYPLSKSWLDELVGAAQQPGIASVAPRILDASGSVVIDAGETRHGCFPQFSDYEGLRNDDFCCLLDRRHRLQLLP